MNIREKNKQQGAVLVIALVMLLVLTFLATSSMRGVSLDARITANRAETIKLQNMAEAALREGEFRLYGPGYVRDKLEANMNENCVKKNKLRAGGLNKPCLLPAMEPEERIDFLKQPLQYIKDAGYGLATGAEVDAASDSATLAWMPYRGVDHSNAYVGKSDDPSSYWNVYRLDDGAQDDMTVNPEYGGVLQGKGTFFFLVTGQANDEVAAQSTVTTIFLGMD